MILWEREKQCKCCTHECGCENPAECLVDGTILYEYEFDCELGHDCNSDATCEDQVVPNS